MIKVYYCLVLSVALFTVSESCRKKSVVQASASGTVPPAVTNSDTFYFGVDLSYVNQLLDHGAIFKDKGTIQTPYHIFNVHGANLVRLRLWHHPVWTKEVYGVAGKQLYSDLPDVEKSIRLAREQGMKVLLDFHYSDSWADPGKQEIPKAWVPITDLSVLKDSIYQYTYNTLTNLASKGLMPELVQIGNETNCGMMYTDAPAGFPKLNVCEGNWQQTGDVINSAIRAVREAALTGNIKPKILLHVADPKNVDWWFSNMSGIGKVQDFDFIGLSYYPLWHTTIPLDKLSDNISAFQNKFGKKVMMLETAYPWNAVGSDSYNNAFGSQAPLLNYPFSLNGQYSILKAITQEIKDGGGSGIIYWEPAWISSAMKDRWGTGSSWENSTLFDFNGNTIKGIDYMKQPYR